MKLTYVLTLTHPIANFVSHLPAQTPLYSKLSCLHLALKPNAIELLWLSK